MYGPTLLIVALSLAQALTSSPRMYVGHISANGNTGKRDALRKHCVSTYYAASTTEYKIFVNQPDAAESTDLRRQIEAAEAAAAGHPHSSAAQATAALAAEAERHGDLEVLPMPETAGNKIAKASAVFYAGLHSGASFIVRADDDFCVNASSLRDQLAALSEFAESDGEVYSGLYEFQGTEYRSMFGPDNTSAPFFSGPFYVLSRGLAHAIFVRDRLHTALYGSYGTSSENANVGKWVQHAERRHQMKVHHKWLHHARIKMWRAGPPSNTTYRSNRTLV